MAHNNIWDDAEITTGQRSIKDGSRYNRYFPSSDQKDTVVVKNGSVEDTVALMKRVAWTYKDDTKQIASVLNRTNLEETCRAIWQFMYHHLQYKLDQEGLEQLRRPARSWQDRTSGVDCDCMSLFASSILTNLKIPHSFRITKYSKPSWQHVYVVVPTPNSSDSYITVDGVLGKFNYEKPYSLKMDYPMDLNGINIAVLSGVDDNKSVQSSDLIYSNAIMGTSLLGIAGTEDLSGGNDAALDAATYQYLLHTRAVAAANPMMLVAAGDKNPAAFLEMLDYAIKHWHTPGRNAALGVLAANEEEMNRLNGYSEDWMQGMDEDVLRGDDDLFGIDPIEGLGFGFGNLGRAKKEKKPGKKGFFKKVGGAIKNHIVRMNPLTIAARNGFLLALKLNIGKMSEKIKWGYATPEQARAKGISPVMVQRAKNAISKIEKLFVKLGGKTDNLRKAVLKSRHGKLSGLGYADLMQGLGDALGVAPLAAGLAAAIPVITAVLKILKDSGLVKKGEKQSMQPSDDETPTLPQEEASTNVFDTAASTPATIPAETVEGLGLGSTGTAIKDFITNNPVIATAGAAIVAFGLYKVFVPDSPTRAPAKPKALAGFQHAPKKFVLK